MLPSLGYRWTYRQHHLRQSVIETKPYVLAYKMDAHDENDVRFIALEISDWRRETAHRWNI